MRALEYITLLFWSSLSGSRPARSRYHYRKIYDRINPHFYYRYCFIFLPEEKSFFRRKLARANFRMVRSLNVKFNDEWVTGSLSKVEGNLLIESVVLTYGYCGKFASFTSHRPRLIKFYRFSNCASWLPRSPIRFRESFLGQTFNCF